MQVKWEPAFARTRLDWLERSRPKPAIVSSKTFILSNCDSSALRERKTLRRHVALLPLFKRAADRASSGDSRHLFPVSYTHLRAHETDSYLVCRLLLEKKNQKK